MALYGHTAGVNGLAFMPDSHSLLSGSEDGTLRLWDVLSGQCVRFIQGYAASLFDIDWSPDDTQLVSGGTDTFVDVWSVDGRTAEGEGTPSSVIQHNRDQAIPYRRSANSASVDMRRSKRLRGRNACARL